MYDIFISYRRNSGSEFASFLTMELTRLGYEVFFDADSLREGDFEEHIDQAIDACTYFLVLLAPGDLDRSLDKPEKDWIVHETRRAQEGGKIIVPVRIKAGFEFPDPCEEPTIHALSKQNVCDMSGVGAAKLVSTLLLDFLKTVPAKRLADEYNKGIVTPEYIAWELETLRSIYYDIPFIHVFDRDFPTFVIAGSESVSYPFDRLTNADNLLAVETELDYQNTPSFNDFKKIVGPHVHYPELYGFTNCGFHLDEQGRVAEIIARPRKYKETVYTCHILQYELWTAYKKIGQERLATLEDLPIRKSIHGDLSNKEVIMSGCNRSALHDVNIAVIDYNDRTHEYSVATATRAETVATYPNYFGIVPSGGFELYELESNQSQWVIEENFAVIGALYREYIEELFGDVEFGQATGNDDLNRIYRNPKIKELRKGIDSGLYTFDFLGVDFDLTTLRQSLAFVLMINDPDYFYEHEIKKNEEHKSVKFTSLKNLEARIIRENLPVLSETAATYTLLTQHRVYREMMATDFKKP